ncbi:amino acid ABC transporter substrate-binding protein [Mycolicibacterium murale]|jgi:ABC-type amino acid transport substrate-binding protein|uniref:Amino acid ABC transporter substrate-binding protein n=1 Tax=Mycolicibacterium murale TaxID=182220 RepID=A0A7I9WP17_9MYCO|nr:transporter substrate-binding domain-containing protein [Mycolicibacterium murale]MCV7182578.1 transporter substrate-binding domain-containing protein [Mycolicibacterium murale]GFG59485.1 amino acid ABC transporter substrate-binding protein [Mycolicibacterium murale]
MPIPNPAPLCRRGLAALTVIATLAACGSSDESPPAGGAELVEDIDTAQVSVQRPPTDPAVAPAVAQACTAEASPLIKQIQDRGYINWATGMSPPFAFKDDGNIVGVEPDNAAELAHILGVEPRIAEFSYDVMPPAITSGKADIIGAQLFNTPARAAVIAFTEPYYVSGQLFYVLEDSPFQTIADLNTPENRFVYGTGNAQGDVAEEVIPQAVTQDAPLQGQALLYNFMATGRADSSMTEGGLKALLLSKYTNPRLAAIGNNGRVTTPLPTEADLVNPFDVAFGYSKDDPGFGACLNAWVTDMNSSGRIQQRIEHWTEAIESD